MSLIGELSVTRDRLDALERLLDERGALTRADLENYAPDPAAEDERRERREAYIRRVMRVVEMEIDETEGGRDNASFTAALAELTRDDEEGTT